MEGAVSSPGYAVAEHEPASESDHGALERAVRRDARPVEGISHLYADIFAADLDPAARNSRHGRDDHVVAANDRHRAVATRQIRRAHGLHRDVPVLSVVVDAERRVVAGLELCDLALEARYVG